VPKNLRGIVDVGWAFNYGFAVRGDGKVEVWTNTDDTAKERAARMLSEELENVAAVECASRRAVFRFKDGTVRVAGLR
jgi:nitrite reductase/ring-hydroxylating ferredoxin subunit